MARERAEFESSVRALKMAKGNISLASKILDIDRKVLTRLLEKLSIEAAQFK